MERRISGIEACVFDAYGTLFDVNAAARELAQDIGAAWPAFSATWREKQLQYTWLRACMGKHKPFWKVTQDALDFALESHKLTDPALRQKLLDLYWGLSAYPEVPDMLAKLKGVGIKTAILSNGSPDMLEGAVKAAGIGDVLDAVISVEDVGVFKPDFRVYKMVNDQMGVASSAVSFQSSNAWDAVAAKAYGFQVAWVNRSGQPPERMEWQPDIVLDDLSTLPNRIEAAA